MGSISDRIIEKGSKNKDIITSDAKEKASKELSAEDRARLIASGMLMDWADEGEAFLEALFSSGDENLSFAERYKKHLLENQEALESARGKEGSLKYELGGAFIPGLATLPFGGAGAYPTIAKGLVTGGKRLAVTGAAQGATTTVGAQKEANPLSRIDDFSDLGDIAFGTTVGAVTSPLGAKAGQKISSWIAGLGGDKLSRILTNELGKPVEDELKRIALSSNKSVEEIVEEIAKGKIIPEIDSNIADEVRAFVAKSSQGGALVKETATKRASEKTKDVFETAQTDLAPETGFGNVKLYYNKSKSQLEDLESKAYNKIFKSADQPNAHYENIGNSILDVARNRKDVANKINSYLEDAGLGKIFEEVTDKTGQKSFQLTRNVNLEVAENVKRAIMDMKESAFRSGNSNRGRLFKDLEDNFRNQIDEISPDLKNTRANWSSIKRGDDAFKMGQKALGKSADDIEVEFVNLMNKMDQTGDKTLLETYRLGVVSALRAKAGTASTKSFIRNLAKDDTNMRAVLERIYPEDKFDDILAKIEIADGSLMNLKKFGELSPTAETMLKAQKVGTKQDAADLTQIVTSMSANAQGLPNTGFLKPMKNLLSRYLTTGQNLSEAQMLQVAKLLISENPDLIKKALTDVSARNKLIAFANKIADGIVTGTASASAITTSSALADKDIIGSAQAEEIDPSNYKYVKDLAGNIKPKVKEKLLNITIDTPKYITTPDGKVQINPQWQKQQDLQQAIIDE
jgi:hypothetical protein